MPEIIVKLGDRIVSRHVIDKDVLSVGRARDNDIVLENLSVSRNHVRIRRTDGKFILTDLNSANGTMVNMVRVSKHEIVDGDQVQVGRHVLHFVGDESMGASADEGGATSEPTSSVNMDLFPGPPAMFSVTKGKQEGQHFRVARRDTNIGRANDNDIRLHDWFVSKKHAIVARREDGFFVRDLQSWRGTTINSMPLRGEVQLKEGDEMTLGTTVLKFYERIPKELEGEMEAQEAARAASSADIPNLVEEEPEPEPIGGDRVPSNTGTQDEFAPMTDDELAALEAESENMVSAERNPGHTAEWENFEVEHMASMNEPIEGRKPRVGAEEELRRGEERAVAQSASEAHEEQGRFASDELAEEERALAGEDSSKLNEGASGTKSGRYGSLDTPLPPAMLSPEDRERLTELWKKALRNKSPLIRKNAAKELKKLTGKDHDWEQPIEGP